jgi:hypothetical protein
LEVGIASKVRSQDLDGNSTIKAHISAGKDLGHATTTDDITQFVPITQSANIVRHRSS